VECIRLIGKKISQIEYETPVTKNNIGKIAIFAR